MDENENDMDSLLVNKSIDASIDFEKLMDNIDFN